MEEGIKYKWSKQLQFDDFAYEIRKQSILWIDCFMNLNFLTIFPFRSWCSTFFSFIMWSDLANHVPARSSHVIVVLWHELCGGVMLAVS